MIKLNNMNHLFFQEDNNKELKKNEVKEQY